MTIWDEYLHERTDERVKAVYPNGIHNELAAYLGQFDDIEVSFLCH